MDVFDDISSAGFRLRRLGGFEVGTRRFEERTSGEM
jgi:hypothetical protein